MKTITAVELRKNLGDILTRVNSGEEFSVTYRNSDPIRISSYKKSTKNQQGPAGLDAINAATKKAFKYDSKKTIKELYGESLKGKYGA